MLFLYPAVFHQEDNSYWVEFPDLEGCQSFGDTLNETMGNAQEALSAYLLTLFSEGKTIPSASELSSIAVPEDGFINLVSCNLNHSNQTKAIKKTLTIPSWLNEQAVASGINFSQTLQEALIYKLQHR